MKKLLYLFTIILLLCSSCRTKQALQEYSLQTDSTKTESSTKKEETSEKSISSSQKTVSDTTSTTITEEEFTIKFDSTGKPTEFHGKKKKIMKQSKNEKNTSLDQHFTADKQSCDSNYIFAGNKQKQNKKIVQPKKKSSDNVLFSVVLSLLTFIICHLVLNYKIKQKKLGA